MLYMFEKGTTESDIREAIDRMLKRDFRRHTDALEMAIQGGCYDLIPVILENRKEQWNSESEAMNALADALFKFPSDIVTENLIKFAPDWINKDANKLIKLAMKYGHLCVAQRLLEQRNVASDLRKEIKAARNVDGVTKQDGVAYLAEHIEDKYVVTFMKSNIEDRNGMDLVDSLLLVPKIRNAIRAHARLNGQDLNDACSIDSLKEYLSKLDTFCQFKRKNKARI